jgi:hypothetical protein
MQSQKSIRGNLLLVAIALNTVTAVWQFATPTLVLAPSWALSANSAGIALIVLSQYPSDRVQKLRIPLLAAGLALLIPLALAVTGHYPA